MDKETDKAPVYLTRFQSKKLNVSPSSRTKSSSKSSSLKLFSKKTAPKFTRKVEKVANSSIKKSQTKSNNAGNARFTRKVTRIQTEQIKGKKIKKTVSLHPDKNSKTSHEEMMINIDPISLLLGPIINEANSMLKSKRMKHSKSKDSLDKENSESSGSEWEHIDGLPDEIDYTEEEHNYVMKQDKDKQVAIVLQESNLIDIRKSDKPLRFKILDMKSLSDLSKSNIISKLDHFYSLETSDNEFHKLSLWVDTLEKMPFDSLSKLPVNSNSNYKDIGKFLAKTRGTLNDAVFGHEEAKDKIILSLAKIISNPDSKGVCIGIEGPMGNGKTTLVKEGICKAMKRPFAFIALGGMQDSSYMIGHEYTYEGSKPGRIIEILTECGCMNPVIYFDELDKISKTEKGMEIENFLCHLTDTSQNTEFHDKYLSGINFDLSKATFIFSYNDPKKVNPILLDRFYKIKTKGFNEKNKTTIFKDYLLPRIMKEFSFNKNDIKFTDEAIKQLINNYTESEKGVRNLKRCIETIVSKINVLRYMYPGEDEIKKDDSTDYKEKLEELLIQAKNVIENAQKSDKSSDEDEKTEDSQNNPEQIKKEADKEPIETNTPNIQLNVLEFSKNISKMEKDLETKEEDSFTYKNDDIIKISCNKFKLPFTISEKNLRKFITKNNDNTSIAHMYM